MNELFFYHLFYFPLFAHNSLLIQSPFNPISSRMTAHPSLNSTHRCIIHIAPNPPLSNHIFIQSQHVSHRLFYIQHLICLYQMFGPISTSIPDVIDLAAPLFAQLQCFSLSKFVWSLIFGQLTNL